MYSFNPRHAGCKVFEKMIKRFKTLHKCNNPKKDMPTHVNVVRLEQLRVKFAYLIESNMYVCFFNNH